MKKPAFLVAGLIIVGLLIVVYARTGGLTTDSGRAMASYGGPPSQFMAVDGGILHFRDEGNGPPLVLLHGSRASLHHGGQYSPQRQLDVVEQLLDHLQIENFYLAGTSAGSNMAVRLAAKHPSRVRKLLLSTLPLKLPASSEISLRRRFVFWLHHELLHTTSTAWYWRVFLEGIFANPAKVTDTMVDRYHMLNGLPNRREHQQLLIRKWYEQGGPERDFEAAGKVTTPVLVQWGMAGPVLPPDILCEITSAFVSANVRVIAYAGLGHKLVMEDPVRTARDAARYVDGEAVGGACSDK
jgi:pimeloyl-ACP methyl ester carboxylesterase